MFADLGPSFFSWLGHQRESVRSAFEYMWLDASGSETDARFGDQHEECVDAGAIVYCATALLPGQPDLHRVLEAQLPRDLIGKQGGLGHQQADQVVGQQVNHSSLITISGLLQRSRSMPRVVLMFLRSSCRVKDWRGNP